MAVYEVPAIDLIPQAFTMSCWYASVQMFAKPGDFGARIIGC